MPSSTLRLRQPYNFLRWLVALGLCGPLALQAASAGGTGEHFSWGAFLGPFHMVLLHYPIGFLTLTVLLEVRAALKPDGSARRAVSFALPLTAASVVVTAALGWLRSGGGEFEPTLLAWHRGCGLAVASLTLGAWGMHWALRRRPETMAVRLGYRGLLGAAFASLVLAGHFGGSLTHGSGFLTQHAPPALRSLLNNPGPAVRRPATETTGDSLYARVVQPAFARKCYQCHGPEKQKGKFRLDIPEALLKGGSSGEAAVVPGDVQKSRLFHYLLVPRTDDDAMPPEGKEPLSPDEVVAVGRWIEAGAKFE